jgi:hypothetical protein
MINFLHIYSTSFFEKMSLCWQIQYNIFIYKFCHFCFEIQRNIHKCQDSVSSLCALMRFVHHIVSQRSDMSKSMIP